MKAQNEVKVTWSRQSEGKRFTDLVLALKGVSDGQGIAFKDMTANNRVRQEPSSQVAYAAASQ